MTTYTTALEIQVLGKTQSGDRSTDLYPTPNYFIYAKKLLIRNIKTVQCYVLFVDVEF